MRSAEAPPAAGALGHPDVDVGERVELRVGEHRGRRGPLLGRRRAAAEAQRDPAAQGRPRPRSRRRSATASISGRSGAGAAPRTSACCERLALERCRPAGMLRRPRAPGGRRPRGPRPRASRVPSAGRRRPARRRRSTTSAGGRSVTSIRMPCGKFGSTLDRLRRSGRRAAARSIRAGVGVQRRLLLGRAGSARRRSASRSPLVTPDDLDVVDRDQRGVAQPEEVAGRAGMARDDRDHARAGSATTSRPLRSGARRARRVGGAAAGGRVRSARRVALARRPARCARAPAARRSPRLRFGRGALRLRASASPPGPARRGRLAGAGVAASRRGASLAGRRSRPGLGSSGCSSLPRGAASCRRQPAASSSQSAGHSTLAEHLDLGLEHDPEALVDPPAAGGHHREHVGGRRLAGVLDEVRVLGREPGAADREPRAAGRLEQLAGGAPLGARRRRGS